MNDQVHGRDTLARQPDDVVRPGTTSSADGTTYTRSSMESGAVGVSHDVSVPETPDIDPRLAMAQLAAQEQERQRLAEELHDGPAQALANAIFQTEIIDHAVRDDPSSARAEVASLRRMLERELDTLRAYINQLRPSLGEAAGLDDALRDSANALGQRAGITVEVRLEASDDDLHEAERTVVLRVAQEAMRNIAKHSGATRAWVRTYQTDTAEGSRWILEVGDNGRGFDLENVAAHPNRRHFGLRFMRERADLLGSQLSIQTSSAAGAIVRLTIDPREDRS
jgi:two-component system sensor histidine kinase DegS